jgi:TonB family protein
LVGSGSGAGGSTLAYYLTLVDRKIQENWIPVGAALLPETVVVVRFRVLRSGQVQHLELETGSGLRSLDEAALRAVRQSLPLPPFPNLLTEPSLDLRYRFVMERG